MSKPFSAIQLAAAMSSPAFIERSDHYPEAWKGKVPTVVRMMITVRSELPLAISPQLTAVAGEEYPVYVNSHGAVSAVFPDGSSLGLKPMEFVVVKFYSENCGYGMSAHIKIMSDDELYLLGQRRRANKDTLVDPVIVDRIYATVMHYRDAVAVASEYLRDAMRQEAAS